MENSRKPGQGILAFFEAEEHQNLFTNCPFRAHLDCLHELDEETVQHIEAHMLGHILDFKAGTPGDAIKTINQEGIDDELRYVYNDCHNDALNEARDIDPEVDPRDKPEYQGFGPEQRGCFGADARLELMAEAIRAYMQNPNYLKTVAPNVAARIRAAVNPNPEINRIIQFN